MVLPASAPHDEPPSREARWIHELRLSLRLSKAAILLHVDRAQPSQLGELVRALAADYPDITVSDDVRAAATAPEGSALVLLPKASDADWLNLERPVFSRRALKAVLFCDRETTVELSQRAPDFYDWISKHLDCPEGPAAHAVLGLRAAFEVEEPIVWTNPDRGGLWSAFSAAFPGQALRWITRPALDYTALAAEIRAADPSWVAYQPRATSYVRRFRWAMAEAGRRTRAILVAHAERCPGYFPVHDRLTSFAKARRALEAAGASQAGTLAALTGLEPEAVDLARELLGRGAPEGSLIDVLRGAVDPGASLAKELAKRGGIDLDAVAQRSAAAPALRAFAGEQAAKRRRDERLQSVALRLARGQSVAASDLGLFSAVCPAPELAPEVIAGGDRGMFGFLVEATLRRTITPELLADLALYALYVGELSEAFAWAQRSLEQSAVPPQALYQVAQTLYEIDDSRGERLKAELYLKHVRRSRFSPLDRFDALIERFDALIGGSERRLRAGVVIIGLMAISLAMYGGYYDLLRILVIAALFVLGAILFIFIFNRTADPIATIRPISPKPRAPESPMTRLAKAFEDLRDAYRRGAYTKAKAGLSVLLSDDAYHQLGVEHPLHRAIVHLYALVLTELQVDQDTLADLMKIVALEGRVAGVEHESFIRLLPILSDALTRTGRAAEAEALLRKLLGPEASLPGESELAPAKIAASNASTEADELLAIFLAQPGTPPLSAEDKVKALRLLAGALLMQGRYEEAEDLLERALARAEGLPRDDRERWLARSALGRVLALEQRYDEAREALCRAASEVSAATRKDPMDEARILRELARVRHRMGEQDAASTAKDALDRYTKLHPSAACSAAEFEDAVRELQTIAVARPARLERDTSARP